MQAMKDAAKELREIVELTQSYGVPIDESRLLSLAGRLGQASSLKLYVYDHHGDGFWTVLAESEAQAYRFIQTHGLSEAQVAAYGAEQDIYIDLIGEAELKPGVAVYVI